MDIFNYAKNLKVESVDDTVVIITNKAIATTIRNSVNDAAELAINEGRKATADDLMRLWKNLEAR